ncbi:hypothetical protein [Burkholderia ubonensis]|uniref:hypothetical protein n=1 Tax=Burkholderia ubonensis TaxID=101571 RepID=UPI000A70C4B6|nr:hypothetical protein [Burkholderia ubonensis]
MQRVPALTRAPPAPPFSATRVTTALRNGRTIRRHASLANQAHLNARDLLEFTLASEKRSDL